MRLHQQLFSLAALLLASLTAFPAAEHAKSPAKTNIAGILIDDFGYENVTANGGQRYQTPVMDLLAATGVRFEPCHVQSLCTPTRVALMTGLSNRRNYANFGFMDPSQMMFGNLLKEAGYATPNSPDYLESHEGGGKNKKAQKNKQPMPTVGII